MVLSLSHGQLQFTQNSSSTTQLMKCLMWGDKGKCDCKPHWDSQDTEKSLPGDASLPTILLATAHHDQEKKGGHLAPTFQGPFHHLFAGHG